MKALLATGRPVDIVAAEPGDLERVRSFYAHLSDASIHGRFFAVRRTIPEGELGDVVAHRPGHITLLATLGAELIGIGEYIVAADFTEAEVAFAVADDHHREGVATLLLERLAIIGRRAGLRTFRASTLAGNDDMQLVFRMVGLTEHAHFEDGVVEVTLDLSSLDGLEKNAADRRRLTASHPWQPVEPIPS